MKFGAVQSGSRVEDRRFLTGRGRFVANLRSRAACRMVLVRATEAHAEIRGVHVEQALAVSGVFGVLTAADLAENGVGPIPCGAVMPSVEGRETVVPPFRLLADGRIRFVGQAVAAVVAETYEQALDGAEAVEIDCVPLPAVTDVDAAIHGAGAIWQDAEDNVSMHWRAGDAEAAAAAFDRAAHVVTLELENKRVSANPIETRAVVAEHDPADDAFTHYTNSQGEHGTSEVMADDVLGIPRAKLRVVCGDVGGGFEMKGLPYVEQALALIAARRFGRPVAWFCERSEALATDYHARDHATKASLALDEEGRFLALKVDTLANVGAFLSAYGLFIPTGCYVEGLPGAYDIPAIEVDGDCQDLCVSADGPVPV